MMNVSFYEATGFSKVREELFGSDESFRLFQNALMQNPRAGNVIPGTGSVRKVRWVATEQAKGKRGGLRILYLYIEEKARIVLLAVYAKNVADDLTPRQRKAIAALATAESATE